MIRLRANDPPPEPKEDDLWLHLVLIFKSKLWGDTVLLSEQWCQAVCILFAGAGNYAQVSNENVGAAMTWGFGSMVTVIRNCIIYIK